ncbi:MAG: RNA polymerase sigma factor RpoS, partial [Gammaproteobacteria bacterium]|nr:RNA polymerase sigma factor RpoS [Gammaproteobacteria bacterium]
MMQAGDEIECGEVELNDDNQVSKTKIKKTASAKKTDVDPDAKVNRKELDATRLYLREIEGSPLLTAEEEVFYSRKALKGDMDSRKKMIECNLRLVVKIARRYMNRG